jgi:hypothetical protein
LCDDVDREDTTWVRLSSQTDFVSFPARGATTMAKYGPKAKEEVKEAMHEFKEGKLKSGGKSQKKATNPKQAIAIGLSKARKKGAKVPKKGG